ncbi:MAG: DUF2092 domain-containing protein [Planctomycetales bacterium]
MQRLSDFYRGLKSFTVKTSFEVKFGQGSATSVRKADSVLAVQSPDKLALRTQPGEISLDIIDDGESLFVNVPSLKRFAIEKAPPSLADLTSHTVTRRLGGTGVGSLLFLFSSEQLRQKLCEGVTWYDDRGIEMLVGQKTRHLRFAQPDGEWDLWFDAEKDPLVRQISRSSTPRPGSNSPVKQSANAPRSSTTLTRRFEDWKLNPPLPPETFEFVSPSDATETQGDLFAPPSRSGKSPRDFLGKSLPEIKLQRLDGEPFRLADHVGKDVVLLDFWATWCGECRVEMPVVAAIAAEYADKHVATYAVNYRENPRLIQSFLQKYPHKLSVVLDSKGDFTHGLEIEAIPVLLLIDRQGILQAVHIGYNNELKNLLRRELDTLLSGKSLVKLTSSSLK